MPYRFDRYRSVLLAAGIALTVASNVSAQTQAASATTSAGSTTVPLKFEVVSVKPSRSGDPNFNSGFPANGDEYNAENVPLLMLIRLAYGMFNVPDEQFEGIPKWAETERFDVVAKVNPADAIELHKITRAQRGAMLQAVLADRFKLRAHFEPKELPVYDLVIAKNGPKLEEAKPGADSGGPKAAGDPKQGPGSLRIAPGQLIGQAADMWALKAMLTQILGRTVLDKTGLTGNYNFELDWAPDDLSGPAPTGAVESSGPSKPSIFSAVQEQLGLKLQSGKGPVNILVIDHVEKPSEN